MTNPTPKHQQEAREIRLPFPCGCLDAHTGGGIVVEEHTCDAHQAIATALSSRDQEIREVLEGLRVEDGDCWCAHFGSEYHTPACLAARGLYEKLNSTTGK